MPLGPFFHLKTSLSPQRVVHANFFGKFLFIASSINRLVRQFNLIYFNLSCI